MKIKNLDLLNNQITKSNIPTIILLAFLLLILPVFIYNVLERQLFTKKAATTPDIISSYNNQLITLSNQYVKGSTSQKNTFKNNFIAVATLRKKQLLTEIKTNPSLFLQHTIPKRDRSKISSDLVNLGLIEEDTSIEGTLSVVHFDDFDNKKSFTEYEVKTKNPVGRQKSSYKLYIATGEINVLTDSQVKVSGLSLDNNLVITNTTSPNLQITSSSVPITSGNQKIAVFLVNFASNPQQPVTKQQVYDLLFTGANSIPKWYQEVSYNKLNFSGDVFGYYTISYDVNLCEYRKWTDEVENLTSKSGINVGNYLKRVFIIFPKTYSDSGKSLFPCNHGGWADIGGNPSRTWISGHGYNRNGLYLHELGHNLGLSHSSAIDCGSYALHPNFFTNPSSCSYSNYGDWWDVMGSDSGLNHFNAAQKLWLQWITGSQSQTVTQNTTSIINSFFVTLAAYETSSTGIKAVKIPIPNPKIPYNYYLEYRRPLGFDANLPQGVTSGVTVHLQKVEIKPEYVFMYPSASYLIDTTPNSNIPALDLYDVSLVDGKSFYDSYNKIYIRQVSHNYNSATILIDLGPGANVTPPPQGPYRPPPTPTTKYYDM